MDVNFENDFKVLTGNSPFPWQRALYERFISNRRDNIPASCNLPTGLGKTSVVGIWLLALINNPPTIPRRLVYVVNRRTVVDQTTNEVERLRENLPKLNTVLGKLAISTLRGKFADNREWSADPSRAAVICGTVDMIGSRLLFSGYGCGFKTKPLHAGFLGQDVLLVHDEAHLEPAFQHLLTDVQKEQERCKEFRPFRVMELSATSRGRGDIFKLTPADIANHIVKQRLHAKKTITFHSVAEEKNLSQRLIELALVHEDNHQAILIFVRTVDDLNKVVAKLPKGQVQQLTGTMRGLEREGLVRHPVFNRFLPDSGRSKDVTKAVGTVYLVCTSAGEVGVNISADHLVCDLTPFDSMAQRFGRVNRFGFGDNARIDIAHPTAFRPEDRLDSAREKTLALLKALNASASPSTIGSLMDDLSDEERKAAFTPEPDILPTSDMMFDAWALTTIRDKLPARPPVADYLHGISEWEPPQTFVAWRSEVWELRRQFVNARDQWEFQKDAAEMLEDYPLKSHELLRDRSSRVMTALKTLTAPPRTPIWVIDDGRVIVTTLGALTGGNTRALEGKSVLLPPQAGGLALDEKGDSRGFFDGAEKFDPERMHVYDVADEWRDADGPLRKRQWNDDTKPLGMKLERAVVFDNPDDEDAELAKVWYWFVRPAGAEANERGVKDYPLQPHLNDAQAEAEKFASRLSFDADIHAAIIFAAKSHDLGKDRERWQRSIGNTDYPAQKWAKSGKRRAAVERSAYRHEFGSLLDVQAQPEFVRLSADAQDLALHLIASHHGRARPHFPPEEVFDDKYPGDKAASLALEVPLRYARLQRRYGRWGLAYLESLVRAADYVASAKASGTSKVET